VKAIIEYIYIYIYIGGKQAVANTKSIYQKGKIQNPKSPQVAEQEKGSPIPKGFRTWAEMLLLACPVSEINPQAEGIGDLMVFVLEGEVRMKWGLRCCHRKSINIGTLAASLAQQILGERCFKNSPSFLSRVRIPEKSVATMGNFLALPLISDECFCNKSNPELPAEDSVTVKLLPPQKLFNKATNYKPTVAQVEVGDGTVLLPPQPCKMEDHYETVEPREFTEALLEEGDGKVLLPHQLFEKASNCESVEAHNHKQTEAQVEEGNATAPLPAKPCKSEKNCESVETHEFTEAQLEEWISTLLLPHQLFEEASNCESVEVHKQTEAQVEEHANALSLPHQVLKKANNWESVEAHKQTEKKVEECPPAPLLPHQLFKKENNDELVEAPKQTEAHAGKRFPGILLPHEFFQ